MKGKIVYPRKRVVVLEFKKQKKRTMCTTLVPNLLLHRGKESA